MQTPRSYGRWLIRRLCQLAPQLVNTTKNYWPMARDGQSSVFAVRKSIYFAFFFDSFAVDFFAVAVPKSHILT